jgi:hypothetical protein
MPARGSSISRGRPCLKKPGYVWRERLKIVKSRGTWQNKATPEKAIPYTFTSLRSRIITPGILILGFLLIILVIISLSVPVHRWGDGSTYYMQVLSIVNDHDIEYTAQDLQRLAMYPLEDAPAGMYLIKTPGGQYFYGKEFSYALFASPFFILLGKNGMLTFNALMLLGMVAMGYLYLRKENGICSAGIALLFFVLSATFVYTFWATPDLYDAFLIMLGFFLWALYNKDPDVKYLAGASLAMGMAMVAKTPNAVVFLPLILYELYNKRYRNLFIALTAFVVPVMLFYGYFYLQSGAVSFYGGDRYYYLGNYPFSGGFDATNEAGTPAFSSTEGDRQAFMINLHDLAVVPYNMAYYFVGRFTGMLWYYPLAAFALISFLWCARKKEYLRENLWVAAIGGSIVLYILFHITLIGGNYSGGGWMIGNRYFYVYPAFLFLLDRVDWKKALPFALVALLTIMPIVADPIDQSSMPDAHTYDFPYQYFPLEYSQIENFILAETDIVSDGMTLHMYGGIPAYSNGYFIINKPVNIVIRTGSPLDSLKVALQSSDTTNARVSIGNITKDVQVNDIQYSVVVSKGMQSEYSNGRYYLYELQVMFYNQS